MPLFRDNVAVTGGDMTGKLTITRTGTPWTSVADPFLFSQGSVLGTITGTGVRAAHVLNINSDAVDGTAVSGTYNAYIGHTVGSPSAKGHRTALEAVMSVSGTTGNTTNKFYTANSGRAIATANDNGSVGNYVGALFGGFDSASLLSGATFWSQVCGREIDVEVRSGASALWKTGLQIVQRSTDLLPGAEEDAAIVLSNQTGGTAPGWTFGLAFGSPHGDWPINVGGTIIGTQASALGGPSYAATHGVDFTNVTFATSAFKSTGFLVDPDGDVTTKTVKTAAIAVASLPSAATAGAGARAFVTDANATTFSSIVASGGANGVPVYSDGTNWRIG